MKRNPTNPLQVIKKQRAELYEKWVLRSFANGSSFRMFKKKSFEVIRWFLKQNGRKLTRLQNREAFDSNVLILADKMGNLRIKTSFKQPESTFPYLVKILDLYVKHYTVSAPYLLGKSDAKRARSLLHNAHVPLDGRILRKTWEHFESDLKKKGIISEPKLKDLNPCHYQGIQEILRARARKANLPAITYDFFWAFEK